MPYTADRRLYLDKNREKVVEEGDPEAAFLLAPEGTEVPDEDVKKYGLGGSGEKAVREAPEDKQVTGPQATKAPAPPSAPAARSASAPARR